jgi:two-component system, NarL family, sensor kinase
MHKLFLYGFICLFGLNVFGQKDTIQIQTLMDKAYGFEVNEPKKALQLYQQSLKSSLKINFKNGAYKSLLYSGIVHSDKGNYDSAIFYYKKNIAYCKKEKIQIGEAKSYANYANTLQFKGDYSEAVKYYLKSIKIFEKTKDSATISSSYQNLSAIYTQFNNRKLEFFYLKKAEQFMPKANAVQLALLYCDIGSGFLRYNNLAEGFTYLKKAEKIAVEVNENNVWFYVIRNFGDYYLIKKEYKQAIFYYEKALKNAATSVDLVRKNDLIYTLSDAYLLDKNYAKAMALANQSLELSKKIKSGQLEYKSLKRIAKIYNLLNEPQKAYNNLEQSYNLMDTVFSREHLKETTLLQTQFETEKKEKALLGQQIQLKKQDVALIEKTNQSRIFIFATIILVLASLGIWLYFKQRQKLKNQEIESLKQSQEITKLEALIDGEENERKRIAQELHDGINGDLSAIKYRISSLEEYGIGLAEKADLQKIIEMIDYSCSQVRNISHNLMPTSILDFGLVETISQYCLKINSSQSIEFDFQHFGTILILPKKTETVIYRIVQELINNSVKHSKATKAMVQMNYHENELFITVEDNGIGFDTTTSKSGIGIKNIASRVDFLKANLEIESSEKGSSFNIIIDLKKI